MNETQLTTEQIKDRHVLLLACLNKFKANKIAMEELESSNETILDVTSKIMTDLAKNCTHYYASDKSINIYNIYDSSCYYMNCAACFTRVEVRWEPVSNNGDNYYKSHYMQCVPCDPKSGIPYPKLN